MGLHLGEVASGEDLWLSQGQDLTDELTAAILPLCQLITKFL